jgi:hypothetical protein
MQPAYHLFHNLKQRHYIKGKQKVVRGLSLRANYTDRAKLMPTFADREVPRGQRHGSLQPCSRLSRLEPLLFLPSSSSIVLTRLSGPRSRPINSKKKLVVQEIEPGTSGSVARNSDH